MRTFYDFTVCRYVEVQPSLNRMAERGWRVVGQGPLDAWWFWIMFQMDEPQQGEQPYPTRQEVR